MNVVQSPALDRMIMFASVPHGAKRTLDSDVSSDCTVSLLDLLLEPTDFSVKTLETGAHLGRNKILDLALGSSIVASARRGAAAVNIR